jgi:ribosomal protein L3
MATSVLNQLTSMPKLPITSGLMETTKKSPKGYLGGAEVGPALEELRGAESAAEKKVGEADVAIEEAKRQEKGREAEQKMQLAERMGKEAREMPERKALGEARQELQEMAFVPTKETAQDLAALFSLVSVIGMVAGKGNSQLAMSAMNGMLEGHQKGRTDLYKQQQIEFDKNFKAMQAKIGTLEKELDEAMKLKAYDKEAGEQAINLALAKSESPLLKAMKDKQGDVAVLNAVRGSKKDLETVVNIQNKLQSEADTRQARKEEMAQRERHHRENAARAERMAKEKMTHAEKMAELKSMNKPASATNERYANTVYRSSNEVLRSLELVEKLGITTGGGVLGSVVGKGTIPSEVQRYLGQAMTDEQQRNYNTAMSGIALELAYVLNGGYKPNEGQINKLETLLSVGPNDTYGNAAYKFADVTAKLKAAVDVSPSYTEDQKQTKQMLLDKMNRYATPEQVQERIYGPGKAEEPAVRTGKVYEPQTDADFNDIPGGELYKDPADQKIYRKPKK